MIFNFIEAVIKFAGKIDHVVRTTFGVVPSQQHSNEMMNVAENEGQQEPKAGKYEITPPPRAYISKHFTSKRHSRRQENERTHNNEVNVRCQEDELHENVELETLVVKKGHVKALIAIYDEISNVSSESFVSGPDKQDLGTRPFQSDSFPITPHRDFEPKPCVRKEKSINKVVTKPPKVASVSSMISHHKKRREPAKSDQRINLFEEAEAPTVGESSARRGNGYGDHDPVLERRIERRSWWSMFCIPMW